MLLVYSIHKYCNYLRRYQLINFNSSIYVASICYLFHCAAMGTAIAGFQYAEPLDIFGDVKLVSQLSSWAQAPKIGTHTHTSPYLCVRACVCSCSHQRRTHCIRPIRQGTVAARPV